MRRTEGKIFLQKEMVMHRPWDRSKVKVFWNKKASMAKALYVHMDVGRGGGRGGE